jgi:hypothetical protein
MYVCLRGCVWLLITILDRIKGEFLFQILLRTREVSPCFRVLKNKYEEDDYEEFQLLILTHSLMELSPS